VHAVLVHVADNRDAIDPRRRHRRCLVDDRRRATTGGGQRAQTHGSRSNHLAAISVCPSRIVRFNAFCPDRHLAPDDVVWFVIDLESRRVHDITGLIRHPHDAWIQQVARNLTDSGDGFGRTRRASCSAYEKLSRVPRLEPKPAHVELRNVVGDVMRSGMSGTSARELS
jgi:hypothetical protein